MKTPSLLLAAAVVTCAPLASAATIRYTATLNAAQTTPANPSSGTGSADLDFDDQTKELRGSISLSLPPGAMVTNQHLHRGKCGESGGLVKTLSVPGNDMIILDPPVKLADDQVAALEAGQLYIDVHTMANQTGEIRGQIYKQGSTETCPASAGGDGGASSSGGTPADGGTQPPAASDDGGGCSTSGSGGGGLGIFAGIGIAAVLVRLRKRP